MALYCVEAYILEPLARILFEDFGVTEGISIGRVVAAVSLLVDVPGEVQEKLLVVSFVEFLQGISNSIHLDIVQALTTEAFILVPNLVVFRLWNLVLSRLARIVHAPPAR